MIKEKGIYALYKDGELLQDTHLFLFEDILTSILTLYLFSVTFACKDLKMYSLGKTTSNINYPLDLSNGKKFICDFYSGIDLASDLLSRDDYKNHPITVDYLKSIINDVDTAIASRYSVSASATLDENKEI